MEFLIPIIILYVVIFFITRELWCWYLKINSREKTLEEISKTLKEINHRLDVSESTKTPKPKKKTSPKSNSDSKKASELKESTTTERTKFQCHSCQSALTTSAKINGKCQKCDAELKGPQLEL